MNLIDVSVEDQALVLAFAQIAQAECGEHSWAEVEPLLASCWGKTHRKTSALNWDEIAPYIRTACDKAG